ncbi:MAG: N-acetylglucosamine-6-phosphate deacetylase [Oscillospiraceae bacterium]|nr:N-acetylglucosamine-6-phosphate deacetylase [Oscillospiraceae bacterium]
MKAIINGRIILKDRLLHGQTIVFNEKITDFCKSAPAGAEVIDAKGACISPGLIDLHIHGSVGEEVTDGNKDGIRKIARELVKYGVTGWLPTTMTVSREKIIAAFEAIRSLMREPVDGAGATILGANMEGPFVSAKKKGAQDERYIIPPEFKMIKEYADVIKIFTIAPEMDTDFSVIKAAREIGITVAMGHSNADYETAIGAVIAGAQHITHLFNGMSALGHREPGLVGAAFTSDVTAELIADTIHVHKCLFELIYQIKKDKLVLITDCVMAGGLPDGVYKLGGQKITVKNKECRLDDGGLAGSVLTLNKAVKNMVDNTSASLYDIVACASLTPANVIGLASRKGSLEIGKDADIVIFDGDIEVKKTIIGGAVVYSA